MNEHPHFLRRTLRVCGITLFTRTIAITITTSTTVIRRTLHVLGVRVVRCVQWMAWREENSAQKILGTSGPKRVP